MAERDNEESDNVEEFLIHFEKNILPIFARHGIIKNTALQIYAMYCFNGTTALFEEPPDESETWRK